MNDQSLFKKFIIMNKNETKVITNGLPPTYDASNLKLFTSTIEYQNDWFR